MLRRALILAVLLVVLVALDRTQRDAATERRQDALRVRAFVGSAQREAKPVAVVRVQDGDGSVHLYGRQEGMWRCLDLRGVPALGDRIEQLIHDLYEAQGVVLSEQPQHTQDYGLDVPAMRTISLHGAAMNPQDADSDLVVAIEVGAAVVGAEGCYARVRGERAIWTIDVDPGAVVGREPGGGRPSLMDPALVPSSWTASGSRLQTLRVAHAGQGEFQLDIRTRDITPEESMAGVPGFEWLLTQGGTQSKAALMTAASYANHVLSAPWVDVVDPALAPTLGLDTPRAEVVLSGGGPEPCSLRLGGRTPSGRSAVLNTFSRMLFEIDPSEEPLLFPQAEVFAETATVNPWDTRAQGQPAVPPILNPPR